MDEELKFYDIHFHTMNLSHANLTAFIERLELNLRNGLNPLKAINLLLNIIKSKIYNEKTFKYKNARNLLAYMESSMMFDYHILEYFLKNKKYLIENGYLNIDDNKFNKIVLCPLIMDFGNKNISDKDAFYDIPPIKPIVEQIVDLLNAIKNYFKYDLEEKSDGTFEFKKTRIRKSAKLFEIYPFMGINTQNYKKEKIENMLDKYFSDFKGDDTIEKRKKMLFDAMGEFDGDIDDVGNCKNVFAGIKVYPPLGFQPWPDKVKEREKVELLYKECVLRNIPIITHCGMGGFKVAEDWKKYTDPNEQWEKVIKREDYKKLKIDFAHFGGGNNRWKRILIEYMKNSNNIYTDFSCNTGNHRYYKKIDKIVTHDEELQNKILFGSDFMINLLYYKSYNEFLEIFATTSNLKSEYKMKFATENAEKFLFAPAM